MVLELALALPAALLLIPSVVLLIECLAATAPASAPPATAGPAAGARKGAPRIAILIPAHDEAGQIGPTIEALAAELGAGDRLIVIADNCGDATAEIVNAVGAAPRAASVTSIERRDPVNVGKGFAISFGVQHLALDPPDVVVLVDADCRTAPGAVAALAREATRTGRPIQGEYLLTAPPDAGTLTRVSALAFLVRNRVRPRGLHRLGLPCLLTGSGMAFPWGVLRDAPATRGNLVEDMVLGLELALQGHAPLLCAEAQISSELPTGRSASLRQRRRWEHGHLHTLTTFVPRLVAAGLARADAGLLGLAADLCVPPLALLVALQMAMLALTVALRALGVAGAAPSDLATVGLAATGLAVAVAWWRFARDVVPFRTLLAAPLYLAWKVPLYALLLVKGRQRTWERTQRRGEDPTSAPGPESRGGDAAKP
jgi:hypothetical protein